MSDTTKSYVLHFGILAILILGFFVLPSYHVGNLSRIMVMAIFAIGYNLMFGYTGLLSLGHALFFAAGMYGFGLSVTLGGISIIGSFFIGAIVAMMVSLIIGYLTLRTRDVAFMIVTLMFSQVGYLIILYFVEFTRGDEGFVIEQTLRSIFGLDLTSEAGRFWTAFTLFALCFLLSVVLVKSKFGRTLIAIKENENRMQMLGYNTQRIKLNVVVISGTISGIAGATYALLFGYVGATFSTVQYSIFPLLWVLLGGAGTTLGPIIGVALMFYLIEFSTLVTDAHLIITGIALVLLTLFAPGGIGGEIRKRGLKWLP